MNMLLNYVAVGIVTTAAAAAVALGGPAMAELAVAHTASRLDVQSIEPSMLEAHATINLSTGLASAR